MASGGLASISSSTGYEPNIVENKSDAEMMAKNDILHKSLESAINQRQLSDCGQGDQGLSTEHGTALEIRIILLPMSNTLCLSKLRSGARRDAMLSIINEHAWRMPLDNVSGLHATKYKLLWQVQ